MGDPNFFGARIWLPSNLYFKEWEALIQSPADALMVDCLKFGYKGPVSTLATGNHPSALRQQRDVAAYNMAEVREGAMLGPFSALPFTPWCKVNALLTQPKKDSQIRSGGSLWTSHGHTPAVSVNGHTPNDTYLDELKKMHCHQSETSYNSFKKLEKVASSTVMMFPKPNINCTGSMLIGHFWD